MGSQDAIVRSTDLFKAGTEVYRYPPDETAARIRELEPALVTFIEQTADRVAGRLVSTGAKIEDVQLVSAELRRLGFATIRAMQFGYFRLWNDLFNGDDSLLGDLDDKPRGEQKKG